MYRFVKCFVVPVVAVLLLLFWSATTLGWQDLAWQDLASQDLAWQDLASQDLTSQDLTSQDLAWPDLTSQDLAWPDLEPGLSLPMPNRIALADTTDIVDVLAESFFPLAVAGDTLRMPYFSNRPLDGVYPGITRAVIVVHGTLRNADDYFQAIIDAASGVPGADSTTLIIAPQFLTVPDLEHHELDEDIPCWTYMGWRQGDDSGNSPEHPRPWTISSYGIADSLFMHLATYGQDLERIIITGHSAGGQFVNRFAAGNQVHSTVVDTLGVDIRYIVANPSTYVYFNEERWVQGTSFVFDSLTPEQIAECPEYNSYKYGLDNPNPYMSIGNEQIRSQYAARHLAYLLGSLDNDPNSSYLDQTCPAMLQGNHRLQRGMVYFSYLEHFFGAGILDLHEMAIVEGVGHSHHGMFTSPCGIFYIFDDGVCDWSPPPIEWFDLTSDLLRAHNCRAVAWGDYDGDGDPDLYLTGTGNSNRLVRNDGDFADATSPPLDDGGSGMCSAWIDHDGDGDLDLYLVNWGQENRLFRNDGGDVFEDVTAGPLAASGALTDQAWADYDRDGDLDLYLSRTNDQANTLLRNDGGGSFTDTTPGPLDHEGDDRGIVWGDFDGDGDADLYLCVGSGENRLFRNEGAGGFADATSAPLNDPGNGSAALWGDFDDDDDLDLYLVNRGDDNRLLRNDGIDGFEDVTDGPAANGGQGRSATWGDYDLDGDLDLYLANSSGANRLLRNEGGDGYFEDATVYPLDDHGSSYCAAWADFDQDGDPDLYLATNNGANKLFRNENSTGHGWLQVDLLGAFSNTAGIGAALRLETGGTVRVRHVGGDAGYLAQNSHRVEFGLGVASAVDALTVRWPSGLVQQVLDIPADTLLVIDEALLAARVGPDGSGVGCLSTAQPCAEDVPVTISRTESTDLRSYSVTLTLGPELALCSGLASITEGPYLSDIGSTQFSVSEEPGNSYTIDCSISGTPCGATAATGTLFHVDVTHTIPDGIGEVAVGAVVLEACDGGGLPGIAGEPALIPIDTTGPESVADLVATQLREANGGDGRTLIQLGFSLPATAEAVEIWRAPFGGYPEYDDAGGSTPLPPAHAEPPPAPWSLTTITASGEVDDPLLRDFWYYLLFARDGCGNVSVASNMTAGTLNYHLGDVTNGLLPGDGDNQVGLLDVSLLGVAYGRTLAPGDSLNYLDVGPTADLTVHTLPTTDDLIGFDDLMMFAANFGGVSFAEPRELSLGEPGTREETREEPGGAAEPTAVLAEQTAGAADPIAVLAEPTAGVADPIAVPRLHLVTEPIDAERVRLRLMLVGNRGDVKGVRARIRLSADHEPVPIERGALLERQTHAVFFAHPPGEGPDIHCAILGAGVGFEGEGEIATMLLGMKQAASARLAQVDLRDLDNRRIGAPVPGTLALGDSRPGGGDRSAAGGRGADALASEEERPTHYALIGAEPNPFNPATTIRFRLPEATRVELRVYDVGGRLVRRLVQGVLPAGEHAVRWDGHDGRGRGLGAGVYFYTFEGGELSAVEKLVLLK